MALRCNMSTNVVDTICASASSLLSVPFFLLFIFLFGGLPVQITAAYIFEHVETGCYWVTVPE